MPLKDPGFNYVPEPTVRAFKEMRGIVQTELGLYIPRSLMGTANGVATLDGANKVVQDPANAQATAGVGKIPIAGADGKLASGYIPLLAPYVLTFIGSSAYTWNNMPAALTEINSTPAWRLYQDLTNFTQVRMQVFVYGTGSANAKIRLQYSTDNGSTWSYMDDVSGPSVSIYVTSQKLQVSDWVNLATGAKREVLLRIVGIDGDGVADPSFTLIVAQFK